VIRWTLLEAGEGFEQRVLEQEPEPFAAVVVATTFADTDLWWLCVRLALGGCSIAAFHGLGCERAHDWFDQACVIAELALGGEEDLRDELALDWDGELEAAPAVRWNTLANVMSSWHADEPLAEVFEFLEVWNRAPEHGLALALDAPSEQAIRAALA
jgi:hypothetical protein